jgi:hypothetical protein
VCLAGRAPQGIASRRASSAEKIGKWRGDLSAAEKYFSRPPASAAAQQIISRKPLPGGRGALRN